MPVASARVSSGDCKPQDEVGVTEAAARRKAEKPSRDGGCLHPSTARRLHLISCKEISPRPASLAPHGTSPARCRTNAALARPSVASLAFPDTRRGYARALLDSEMCS